MCSPADPDYYKNLRYYKRNDDLEDIYRSWDTCVPAEELGAIEEMVRELVEDGGPSSRKEFESHLAVLRRRHRFMPRKASLLHVYRQLVGAGELAPCAALEPLLVKKSAKSQSGVLVITVLTSPYPAVGDKARAAADPEPTRALIPCVSLCTPTEQADRRRGR